MQQSKICAVGAFIAAAITLSAPTVQAATLNVVGGQLFGASDVNVNGNLYDVEFLDGTCADVFEGCNEVDDFAFASSGNSFDSPDAVAAAQALLDQVLIDGPLGQFNSDSTLVNGIDALNTGTSDGYSYIYIPFSTPFCTGFLGQPSIANASNHGDDSLDSTGQNGACAGTNFGHLTPTATFARFTLTGPAPDTSPVPLPFPGVLLGGVLLAGFGFPKLRRGRG